MLKTKAKNIRNKRVLDILFQAEEGKQNVEGSRGRGDVYKKQLIHRMRKQGTKKEKKKKSLG